MKPVTCCCLNVQRTFFEYLTRQISQSHRRSLIWINLAADLFFIFEFLPHVEYYRRLKDFKDYLVVQILYFMTLSYCWFAFLKWFRRVHVHTAFLINDDKILSSHLIYKHNFTCLLFCSFERRVSEQTI